MSNPTDTSPEGSPIGPADPLRPASRASAPSTSPAPPLPPAPMLPATPTSTTPSLPPAGSFGSPVRQSKRSWVIVTAVVAVVGLSGGVGALVNGLHSKDDHVAAQRGVDAARVVSPKVDPDAGPKVQAPAQPVSQPGPRPEPAATTTSQPPAGPGAKDPNDGPSTPSSGQAIVVGEGVTITPAEGYEVDGQDDHSVALSGPHGIVYVTLYRDQSQAPAVLSEDLRDLAQYLQDIKVEKEAPISPPTAALVDGYGAIYTGYVASAQGGTTPVEGYGVAFVRQDGLGIAFQAVNAKGNFGAFKPEMLAMVNSIDYGG